MRSVLYVPGSNGRALEKARALNCDAIIFDWEDAVGPDAKLDARTLTTNALSLGTFNAPSLFVRVNAIETAWGADDLRALPPLWPFLTGLVVPKVRRAADLDVYAAALANLSVGVGLWPMIETCDALFALVGIAKAPRVSGLILGLNDLSSEMGVRPGPERRPFFAAMSMAVAAGRMAGLPILDGVCNSLDDIAAMEAEARQAREFGFDGKTLIHPSQIEPCARAFAPSDEERDWAHLVLAAYNNQSGGAVRVAGKMIEKMHVDLARRTLGRILPAGR